MKAKRLIHSIAMLFLRSGRKRADWLKKTFNGKTDRKAYRKSQSS